MTDNEAGAGSTHPAPAGIHDTITNPGVYEIPAEQYHADPVPGGSLSSTGARRLLECPAKFEWDRRHPQPFRRTFELGTAAHCEVLGTGPELVVIDADSYRTKAAQEQRDTARMDGYVPLLPAEYEQVQAMARALRAHPVAGPLFDPAVGKAERSLFWQDQTTGVQCRARLDWMRPGAPGRLIVPDYKTTVDASTDAVQRTIHTYGYHQQADWYMAGAKALGLAEVVAFLLVFQEKTAPYLVHVVELTQETLNIGRHRNRKARALYKSCSESGHWPGYSDGIDMVSLPAWAEKNELEDMS